MTKDEAIEVLNQEKICIKHGEEILSAVFGEGNCLKCYTEKNADKIEDMVNKRKLVREALNILGLPVGI